MKNTINPQLIQRIKTKATPNQFRKKKTQKEKQEEKRKYKKNLFLNKKITMANKQRSLIPNQGIVEGRKDSLAKKTRFLLCVRLTS